ncbi:MAG TPA: hypothetical protein VK920_02085 [Solirubrobacterales bacterium]|nr:hypothetical protein [Solirubrobacterales bacterium]
MSGVPHSLDDERPAVPRIVLPVTARGVELTDRLCWLILGVAMALAAGLILYLNRGTTFFLDELAWVYESLVLGGIDDVLEPHNGHLIATSRLVYKAILETIGAEYVAFRLLGVAAVLLSAALFYALAKRRLGALPALAPALVVLFLGSAWQHVVIPIGFTVISSVAAGLGALLALERDDRRGDVAACALLVLSLATYTTGLGFVAGVAVHVLTRPDRWRRAWIFGLPLILYAAWWVWALDFSSSAKGEAHASNLLLIPDYLIESLATAVAAIVGVGYDFAQLSPPGSELGWGRALAVLTLIALGVRLARGSIPRALWVMVAVLLSYWVLGALAASGERAPWAPRYVYFGAVGVLLVAAEAVRPLKITRVGLVALFAVTAFSLATNLGVLRNGSVYFKDDYSIPARAQFAMLELARGVAADSFDPAARLPQAVAPVGAQTATYYELVDRYGSLAFSLDELSRQSEAVRQGADRVLAQALALRLVPAQPPRTQRRCERVESSVDNLGFELPPRGATLRVDAAAPASLSLSRFAGFPAAKIGRISPGRTAALTIPTDVASTPWHGVITGAVAVTVCPLAGEGGASGPTNS